MFYLADGGQGSDAAVSGPVLRVLETRLQMVKSEKVPAVTGAESMVAVLGSNHAVGAPCV